MLLLSQLISSLHSLSSQSQYPSCSTPPIFVTSFHLAYYTLPSSTSPVFLLSSISHSLVFIPLFFPSSTPLLLPHHPDYVSSGLHCLFCPLFQYLSKIEVRYSFQALTNARACYYNKNFCSYRVFYNKYPTSFIRGPLFFLLMTYEGSLIYYSFFAYFFTCVSDSIYYSFSLGFFYYSLIFNKSSNSTKMMKMKTIVNENLIKMSAQIYIFQIFNNLYVANRCLSRFTLEHIFITGLHHFFVCSRHPYLFYLETFCSHNIFLFPSIFLFIIISIFIDAYLSIEIFAYSCQYHVLELYRDFFGAVIGSSFYFCFDCTFFSHGACLTLLYLQYYQIPQAAHSIINMYQQL